MVVFQYNQSFHFSTILAKTSLNNTFTQTEMNTSLKSIGLYCAMLLCIAIISINSTDVMAGNKADPLIRKYIAEYENAALVEKETKGIPASIKLAQGIIESRYGTSALAIKANNHFGIKCKVDWKGERVSADDDEPNECFRKYPSAQESYSDHSNFLKDHRLNFYDHLFEIDIRDYRSWSMGLQEAGYSTTNYYARSLIYLIEKFELYELDNATLGWRVPDFEREELSDKARKVFRLTYKTGLPNTKTKVFPKEVKLPGILVHTVKEDDTMESIAKQYKKDVQMLYDLNSMFFGSQPAVGEVVYLNYPASKPPKIRVVQYEKPEKEPEKTIEKMPESSEKGESMANKAIDTSIEK